MAALEIHMEEALERGFDVSELKKKKAILENGSKVYIYEGSRKTPVGTEVLMFKEWGGYRGEIAKLAAEDNDPLMKMEI